MLTEPSPPASEARGAEICGEIQPYWEGMYFCEREKNHEGNHIALFPMKYGAGYCVWDKVHYD